jgi:drug/metabolite transporter (DMT)-like permease
MSAPITCIVSLLLFGEKLRLKDIIGTATVVGGVVWVSLAKGEVIISEESRHLSEEARSWYKFASVGMALVVALISSIRTL